MLEFFDFIIIARVILSTYETFFSKNLSIKLHYFLSSTAHLQNLLEIILALINDGKPEC